MKILKALWNWLRGIDSKVAEKMKDPIVDRKLAIDDAKKAQDQYREALASSMAQVTVMEAEIAKLKVNFDKYGRLAKIALEKGNEADATNLLIEQDAYGKKMDALSKDLDTEQKYITKHRQLLEREADKIKEVESQTGRLEAKKVAVDNRAKLAKLRDSDSFKALDNLDVEIATTEAFAESLDELNTDPSEALEDKYNAEAASESVQERLAKMKAEMAEAAKKEAI